MKAFTKTKYGGPEVLRLTEEQKPSPKNGHILVKVVANSPNPADWHILRGTPVIARFAFGLFKPKSKILGADFSGIVEEAANNVNGFKVGDKVFGASLDSGAFAEYLSIAADACSLMPKGTRFSEMASVPIAGVTAFQAVFTHGKLKAGETVLINGSSGGVGHFAVQMAKAIGGNVTAVCSGKNVDFVKSLGADRVIAYDKENIHRHNAKYDLVIDTHGNLTHQDYQRMGQRGVVVGFTTLGHMLRLNIKAMFKKPAITQFTAKINTKDLEQVASLIHKGAVKVHLEKVYPYHEIPAAIGYIEAMHTKGKVAMVWETIDGV